MARLSCTVNDGVAHPLTPDDAQAHVADAAHGAVRDGPGGGRRGAWSGDGDIHSRGWILTIKVSTPCSAQLASVCLPQGHIVLRGSAATSPHDCRCQDLRKDPLS